MSNNNATETKVNPETGEETEVPASGAKSSVDFGNGKYSIAARELYLDIRRLIPDAMSREQAEKAAKDWASDIGRAMANSPSKVSHGKTDKNGKISLKEACNVKGITETRNMTLARFIDHLNDARKAAKVLGLNGTAGVGPEVVVTEIDW